MPRPGMGVHRARGGSTGRAAPRPGGRALDAQPALGRTRRAPHRPDMLPARTRLRLLARDTGRRASDPGAGQVLSAGACGPSFSVRRRRECVRACVSLCVRVSARARADLSCGCNRGEKRAQAGSIGCSRGWRRISGEVDRVRAAGGRAEAAEFDAAKAVDRGWDGGWGQSTGWSRARVVSRLVRVLAGPMEGAHRRRKRREGAPSVSQSGRQADRER